MAVGGRYLDHPLDLLLVEVPGESGNDPPEAGADGLLGGEALPQQGPLE